MRWWNFFSARAPAPVLSTVYSVPLLGMLSSGDRPIPACHLTHQSRFTTHHSPLTTIHHSRLQMDNDSIREVRTRRARFGAVAGELPGDVIGDVQLSSRT